MRVILFYNLIEKISKEVFKLVIIHAIVLETALWVTKAVVNSYKNEIS